MNNESTPIKPEDQQKTDKPQITKGGRNLVLLGTLAVAITFLTTFIALKLYHDSGDIYLDRSRPGFLPEKEEVEIGEENKQFSFSDSGKLTQEVLDEYLENLKQEINRVNDFSSDPFGTVPLSDETLGL